MSMLRETKLFRFIFGISGMSLARYGFSRRDSRGMFFLSLGVAAMSRAISPIGVKRFFQFLFHPIIRLQRTIEVNTPIEVAYDFWKAFTNYSRFMSYIQEVRVNEKFGLTWTIVGPVEIPIRWKANLSAMIPNQLIAWKSLPKSMIMNSGHILFQSTHHGEKTQIHVDLIYAPPAGMIGHEVSRILGFDPRTRIDGDLLTMKNLIEQEFLRTGLRAV